MSQVTSYSWHLKIMKDLLVVLFCYPAYLLLHIRTNEVDFIKIIKLTLLIELQKAFPRKIQL